MRTDLLSEQSCAHRKSSKMVFREAISCRAVNNTATLRRPPSWSSKGNSNILSFQTSLMPFIQATARLFSTSSLNNHINTRSRAPFGRMCLMTYRLASFFQMSLRPGSVSPVCIYDSKYVFGVLFTYRMASLFQMLFSLGSISAACIYASIFRHSFRVSLEHALLKNINSM
jgi:hypothetical protein